MTTSPTPDTAALTARIAAKKAEPAFRDAAKILEAPVPLGIVQAQTLREAAAEIAAMDPAEAALAGQYAFHNAAAQLHRMANEAEFVATPCDPMVACEDGGEPCHTHERLMAHAEGDHELCEPGCVAPAAPAVSVVSGQTLRDRVAEAPAVWVDGHPQLEAIAAAVWEHCRTEDTSLVVDDPRNIAVAAFAAVLRVLPSTADWDGLVREADRLRREGAALDERAAEVEARVAAFAAALPPDGHTTNRAAVLLETAAFYDQLLADMGSAVECDPRYWQAIRRVATELRGKAAEAPQPACPDPIECSHEAALGEARARLQLLLGVAEVIEANGVAWAADSVRRAVNGDLSQPAAGVRQQPDTETPSPTDEDFAVAIDSVLDRLLPAIGVSALERTRDQLGGVLRPLVEQLRRERDLAIAHDRQPYPTAWAYEQACKTLRRKEAVIEGVLAVLDEYEGTDWSHTIPAQRIRAAAASAVPGRSAATSTDEETRS